MARKKYRVDIAPEAQGDISPEAKIMTISLAEDVKTVDDLASDPRALLAQVRSGGRPVVIAETGKPSVVMLTAERYEWLVHLVNFARLMNEGEASIQAEGTRPLEEFIKELEDEGKLPRRNRAARRG